MLKRAFLMGISEGPRVVQSRSGSVRAAPSHLSAGPAVCAIELQRFHLHRLQRRSVSQGCVMDAVMLARTPSGLTHVSIRVLNPLAAASLATA